MKNTNKKIIYISLASLFLITTGFLALLINYSFTPIDNKDEYVVVDIPAEASFSDITKILADVGLIKNRLFFNSLAIIKKAKNNIKSGEYEIKKQITPWALINRLARGPVQIYRVMIFEDSNIREIAEQLDSLKLINKKEFLMLAKDREFLESVNIKASSIEGYLFPDTYVLTRSMGSRKILEAMINNFWRKVTPEMIKKANDLELSVNQWVTLASIVGKEKGIDKNKYKISATFHSRLKKNMCLQSSYSAVYDLEDFKGKVLSSHLKRKSPYNTFIIKGLPPGPIANPGFSSLQAALYPVSVN